MSFEDGSEEMQNPFGDESTDADADEDIIEEDTPPTSEPENQTEASSSSREPTTNRSENSQATRTVDSTGGGAGSAPDLREVDILQHYSTEEIAQLHMAREYHEENPQVPYAMWRNGTSTGRSRTTIELNPDIDELVKTAMREFENRYDAEINKADLREFALVYGLMNADDLFEMAEEWGLQFNG